MYVYKFIFVMILKNNGLLNILVIDWLSFFIYILFLEEFNVFWYKNLICMLFLVRDLFYCWY